MVIDAFKSKVVFLDTAPLIYFIEGNSEYKTVLKKLFQANAKRRFFIYYFYYYIIRGVGASD